MRSILIGLASLGVLGSLAAAPVHAQKADFALFDMEDGVNDVSVQAGCTKGSASKPKPAPFELHITMTNRGDLGGVDGFVRVTYRDGDFVDFHIAGGATLQISLVGGGTPGVDDIITVTGGGGAVLIGQISLLTQKGKPHPDLAGQDGESFCTTTPAPPPPK